ncbi:MAG: hypothetical protein GY771_15405, partial [bacterium]|nr:hypothetical protein [bacterium]
MRNLVFILYAAGLLYLAPAVAKNGDVFNYEFQFGLEGSSLDGLSLRDDPAEDRLLERDIELEFDLEYQISDNAYLFFTGALIDETETIETSGLEEDVTGLERRELGLGYYFGDEIRSELTVGRMEFSSLSEWWLWWD